MNSNDIKFFDAAALQAEHSNFHKEHLGCVAVYNNKIISNGFNSSKTHPEQMIYNEYRGFKNKSGINHTLHAEMMCLINLQQLIDLGKIKPSKIKLYVFRPKKSTKCGMARPCPACMHKIRDMGIKTIFYTTDFGYAKETIK